MTAPLSPLERLGLEVAAERLLCGNRGLGRLLSVLLCADGSVVSARDLRGAQVQMRDREPKTENTVQVRVCLLRAALADVGVTDAIRTHWGKGYSLPEPGRTRVLERLIAEAA